MAVVVSLESAECTRMRARADLCVLFGEDRRSTELRAHLDGPNSRSVSWAASTYSLCVFVCRICRGAAQLPPIVEGSGANSRTRQVCGSAGTTCAEALCRHPGTQQAVRCGRAHHEVPGTEAHRAVREQTACVMHRSWKPMDLIGIFEKAPRMLSVAPRRVRDAEWIVGNDVCQPPDITKSCTFARPNEYAMILINERDFDVGCIFARFHEFSCIWLKRQNCSMRTKRLVCASAAGDFRNVLTAELTGTHDVSDAQREETGDTLRKNEAPAAPRGLKCRKDHTLEAARRQGRWACTNKERVRSIYRSKYSCADSTGPVCDPV